MYEFYESDCRLDAFSDYEDSPINKPNPTREPFYRFWSSHYENQCGATFRQLRAEGFLPYPGL